MREFMNIVENASPAKQLVAACKSTELVTLAMSVDNDTNVTIDDFWSEVERGKGHASAAMRDLVAKADELGVTLWLTAYPMHYPTRMGSLAIPSLTLNPTMGRPIAHASS